MPNVKVLKHTQYGPVLARKKNESLSSLAKRQSKAYSDYQKVNAPAPSPKAAPAPRMLKKPPKPIEQRAVEAGRKIFPYRKSQFKEPKIASPQQMVRFLRPPKTERVI